MNRLQIFNSIESFVWITIGIVLLIRCRKFTTPLKIKNQIAGIFFVLFGISDIVEVKTGQWWSPWWLLAWKAICVVVLFISLLLLYKAQKNGEK